MERGWELMMANVHSHLPYGIQSQKGLYNLACMIIIIIIMLHFYRAIFLTQVK